MSFYLIIFKLCITCMSILEYNCLNTSNQLFNDNLLKDFNKKLQNSVNDLFMLLQVSDKLRTNPKIMIFHSMHQDLKFISEQNYKKYEEIVNETSYEKDNLANLADINEIFKEVVNDKFKSMKIIFNNTEGIPNVTDSGGNVRNIFSKQLVKKPIDDKINVTDNDFHTPLRSSDIKKVKMKNNIKVWKASLKEIRGTNLTRRMYKAMRTRIKKYPFVASILLNNEFLCGGTIIWKDLLLSAASCLQLVWNNRLYQENPSLLAVRVGSSYTGHLGELIPVLELFFHPQYNPRTLQHNLVVLRLRRHLMGFDKKTKNMRRIEFDHSKNPLPVNVDRVVILGWGATHQNNKIHAAPQKLSMASLPYYDLETCKDVYTKEFVTGYNFCAGFMTIGTGACNGDTGDPAIVGNILMGVVSFGPPVCGTPNAPTVFTKIGFYSTWIGDIIEQPVPMFRALTTVTKKPTRRSTLKQTIKTTRAKLQPISGIQPRLLRNDTTVVEDIGVNDYNNKSVDYSNAKMPVDIIKDLLKQIIEENSYAELRSFLYGADVDKSKTSSNHKISTVGIYKTLATKSLTTLPLQLYNVTVSTKQAKQRISNSHYLIEPYLKSSSTLQKGQIIGSNECVTTHYTYL